MGSQLQIGNNANFAAEGPLHFCSSGAVARAQALKNPKPFIIVFNYLPNDRAGIPAAHWGPLCEPISRGCAGQSPYFLPSRGLSAEFCFHADAFLSYLPLVFNGYFPCSAELRQQMQPYVTSPGFGYPDAILKFSSIPERKWGCSVQDWPWSTDFSEMSRESSLLLLP